MCVVGNDSALVIHDFGRTVSVHGYRKGVGDAQCDTVSAVIAYDHPGTGEVFYLTIHQAILMPSMDTNLLSPMQLRDIGIRVNDEPKHMTPNPTDSTHAITIPLNNDHDQLLIIPLSYDGVTSYFPTRKPTSIEYECSDPNMRIDLTAEMPEWDPSDNRFQLQEEAMLDPRGQIRELDQSTLPIHLSSIKAQGQ
jgi:hypothetical protein